MSKNPVVPFILIFALGIGLIFFMSLYGLEQKAEISGEGNTEGVGETFNPEDYAIAQAKCISCHGGNLEGSAAAPSLHNLTKSKDEIVDILKNGVPGTSMFAGTVPAEHMEEMADWLLTLK